MKEEFNLSEKIKNLFEVEYLDSMADVQGDATLILKEFIRLLKYTIANSYPATTNQSVLKMQFLTFEDIEKQINKLAGDKLI